MGAAPSRQTDRQAEGTHLGSDPADSSAPPERTLNTREQADATRVNPKYIHIYALGANRHTRGSLTQRETKKGSDAVMPPRFHAQTQSPGQITKTARV